MSRILSGLIVLVAVGWGSPARAQCGADSIWQTTLGTGTATASTSDTSWNLSGQSFSFVAQGNKLYVVNNNDSTQKWETPAFTQPVQNFPTPVPLRNSTATSVIIANGNGNVYRYDFTTTLGLQQQWVTNLKRPTCSADSLIATPAVQLYNYSNAAFQGDPVINGDDLVFVITRYQSSAGCPTGHTTRNKVVALRASTGAVVWTFNASGAFMMDYGSEGCSIDYDSNTLYCATHMPAEHPQPTLWAINTITGAPVWWWNADSIITRPHLRNGRIYVGTQAGSLRVRNASDGAELWVHPVTTTGTIARSVWPEPRFGLDDLILVTETGSPGRLHAIVDADIGPGTGGWIYTPAAGASVTTIGAITNLANKVFVGQSNGELHQLNGATGLSEAHTFVGGTVFDPSLDARPLSSADINVLNVTSSSLSNNFKTFSVPWDIGEIGTMSEPPSYDTPQTHTSCTPTVCTDCVPIACSIGGGSLYALAPKPDLTPCSDGVACTCENWPMVVGSCTTGSCPPGGCDVCRSGICSSKHRTAECVGGCGAVGGLGCTDGLRCCGPFGCRDLMNDVEHCGACGNNCNTKRFGMGTFGNPDKCVQGLCVRDEKFFCKWDVADEAVLNPVATQLRGASNLTHLKPIPAQGSSCSAFASLFNLTGPPPRMGCDKPWNNGIRLVTEHGWVTGANQGNACGVPVDPFGYASAAHLNNWLGGVINNQTGLIPLNKLFHVYPPSLTNPVMNPGFEALTFSPWVTSATPGQQVALVTVPASCHGGSKCARVGSTSGVNGTATLEQTFTMPTTSKKFLDLWYWEFSADTFPNDSQKIEVRRTDNTLLWTVLPAQAGNGQKWKHLRFDLSSVTDASVKLYVEVDTNNATLPTYLMIDDVSMVGMDIDDGFADSVDYHATPEPFQYLGYKQGVVGPVWDQLHKKLYFGNWPSDGSLIVVSPTCGIDSASCGPPYSGSAAPGWTSLGTHITSLASSFYGNCESGTCVGCPLGGGPLQQVVVYASYGTKVAAYFVANNCAGNVQDMNFADITDPALYQLDPSNPQTAAITGFTSISADPLYGDLYLEGRDANGFYEDFVLYVPNTPFVQATKPQAFYNLADMAKSLKLSGQQNGMPITVPYRWTGEGRLSAGSGATVVRMAVNGPDTNPSFVNLPFWP